jgi:invasion protein IalB
MINKFSAIILFSISLFSVANSFGQKLDKTFGDWSVLTTNVDSEKICYAASLPIKRDGTASTKGNAYFLVSVFPQRSPEVSYSPGFDIKIDNKVKLDVDSNEFLLTKISEKVVWAENSDIDSDVVNELKKGIKLKVLAPDNTGEYSLDTFSLKGFTAAYNHTLKLCNFSF